MEFQISLGSIVSSRLVSQKETRMEIGGGWWCVCVSHMVVKTGKSKTCKARGSLGCVQFGVLADLPERQGGSGYRLPLDLVPLLG